MAARAAITVLPESVPAVQAALAAAIASGAFARVLTAAGEDLSLHFCCAEERFPAACSSLGAFPSCCFAQGRIA